MSRRYRHHLDRAVIAFALMGTLGGVVFVIGGALLADRRTHRGASR